MPRGGCVTRSEARAALAHHEETPASAATARGGMATQEGADMNITTIHRGSVVDDPRIEIRPASLARDVKRLRAPAAVEPAEADWAESRLAHAEVLVRQCDDRTARVWQAPDGEWFRTGGYVNFRRQRDGIYRFVIHLYAGANANDYLFLRRVVEAAKEGRFERFGWQRVEPENNDVRWWYDFSRSYAPSDADLRECADRSSLVTACTDSRCRDAVHTDAGHGATHTVDEIDTDHYAISIERYFDRDGETERFSVVVNTTGEEMTHEQVASFVSDLQWMAETCRRANETVPDPVTKGMRDPAAYWAARRTVEAVAA